jgi:hypothetical protein
MSRKKLLAILAFAVVLILTPILVYTYIYIGTNPEHIRNPKVAHHHIRMQLVVDGQYINFADSKFQEEYIKGQCAVGLSDTPIHFHDGVDQIAHIHWDKMRGGDILKNYGLNKLGGGDNRFGYRLDEGLLKPKEVKIHGDIIPNSNSNSILWIYTKKDNGFTKRESADFIQQDLETFFNKKSTLTLQREEVEASEKTSFWPKGLTAQAHGGIQDGHPNEKNSVTTVKTQEELQKVNNLIGDVIIFAQKDEPKQEDVQKQFDSFVELTDSTCGG